VVIKSEKITRKRGRTSQEEGKEYAKALRQRKTERNQ
jgi:hypothetical protein